MAAFEEMILCESIIILLWPFDTEVKACIVWEAKPEKRTFIALLFVSVKGSRFPQLCNASICFLVTNDEPITKQYSI